MYFLTALEAGSPRSRCVQGQSLVSPPSLVLQVPFSLCLPAIVPLHTETALWCPSSYKDTSSLGSGSHLTTSFNLSYLHEEPVSKEVHIELEDSIHEFWGEQFRGWWPHTIDYYSAFLKGGILTEAAAWMNLEDNMLNEINQLQKDRYGSTSMQ